MSVEAEQPQPTEAVSELEAHEPNGGHHVEPQEPEVESEDVQSSECESMDTQQESSAPVEQIPQPESSAPVEQIPQPTDVDDTKEEKKLFIGGLDRSTTKESLEQYFEGFGKVSLVDLKVDRNDEGKLYHRGFAFVTMDTKELVEEILKKDEHYIDGKKVDCKQAMKHAAYQAKKTELLKTKKVFVGGVPAEMTKETLHEYFIVYGEIEEVAIVVDKVTKARRGFVFVTYKSFESVDKVIEKSFHTIGGHQVEVKKAIPRDDAARGRGRPMRGGPGRGGWQPYGGAMVYPGYEPYGYGGGYMDYGGGGHYGDQGFYGGGGRGYGSRYGPMKGNRGAARGFHPYGR